MSTVASEFAARREGYERMREAISHYGFTPGALVRVGSGYRVEGPTGPYFLKRFAFSPAEANLMYEILEHLRTHGLPQVPRIHLTREGQPFVAPGTELYYLQDWLDLTPADISDPATLATAVDLLAQMHRAAEGFSPSPETAGVREHYGSWLNKCVNRLRDMYSFAELASDRRKESRFDARYAKASLTFDRYAEEAVRRMADLPLSRLADREREAGAFCHRNFSPRNLALDGRSRLRVLDFDNAGREIRFEDLAKFVRRAGAQDLDRTAFILERYSQATGQTLGETELGLLSAHLLFPTEFWAIGNSRFRKDHHRERALSSILNRGESWSAYANAVRKLHLPRAAGELVLPTFPGTGAGLVVSQGPSAASISEGLGPIHELPEPIDLPVIPVFMTDGPPADPLRLARLDTESVQRQLALHQESIDAAAGGGQAIAGREEDNMQRDTDRRQDGQKPAMPAAQPGWEAEVAKYVNSASDEAAPTETSAGILEAVAAVVEEGVEEIVAEVTGLSEEAPASPFQAYAEPEAAVPETEEAVSEEAIPEPTQAEFLEHRQQLASRATTIVWGKWPKPKSRADSPQDPGESDA